ncbi:MAG: shikimate kinase [Longimicrobiales bacterium]|nr:shikimate kinase [Longimicrobiales bacterium]
MEKPRRIVLVGFMGSGKSTVGRLLAEALGWDFADFDAQVEAAEGRTVAAIFAESGEAYFRAAEALAAERLLARDRVVLASGGGWAAEPGRLRSLPEGTTSVWLRVSPEEAVRRAGALAGSRPLLVGPDPVGGAVELLRARTPSYDEAGLEVDTEGRTPEDVAVQILALLEVEHRKSLRGRDAITA